VMRPSQARPRWCFVVGGSWGRYLETRLDWSCQGCWRKLIAVVCRDRAEFYNLFYRVGFL
jgi:hypothetical protein